MGVTPFVRRENAEYTTTEHLEEGMTGIVGRRQFVGGLVGLGTTMVLPGFSPSPASLDKAVIGETPLRERAEKKGLLVGTAMGPRYLHGRYGEVVVRDCNIIVPEGELKWRNISTGPGLYSFRRADTLLNFAHGHGLAFRGHTLLWHQQLPRWVKTHVTKENARDVLTDHIRNW